jgi:hypothetical protein
MSKVKKDFNKDCNIPSNYCDPSIKSLEEELKIAFKIGDDCLELSGFDKKQLIETVNKCNEYRIKTKDFLAECISDVELWHNRAEQIRITYSNCSEQLNICNSELNSCSSVLLNSHP